MRHICADFCGGCCTFTTQSGCVYAADVGFGEGLNLEKMYISGRGVRLRWTYAAPDLFFAMGAAVCAIAGIYML